MSQTNRRSSRMINQRNRRGITIVEILIAITISLTVLLALAVAFREMSKEISNGRSVMELATKLKNATETIRNDLENATVTPRHWTDNASQLGYFEVGEGPSRDTDGFGSNFDMQGDIDDYIALTVRSEGKPFRGRLGALIIESPVAEVIYWTEVRNSVAANPVPNNAAIVDYSAGESLVLHRRVLLVRPDLDLSGLVYAGGLNEYYQFNDVSARFVGGSFVPNSLEELTLFENRYAHTDGGGTFPLAEMDRNVLALRKLSGNNEGEDVLLTDMLGFDLAVYSSDAPVVNYSPAPANPYDNNQYAVEPNDTGYSALVSSGSYPTVLQGAFVDMGFAGGVSPFQFFGNPQSLALNGTRVWTNWTMHYEKDGIDQDGLYGADTATNGIDDDGINGVDDTGERDTLPPYPYPLRGLQVKLRLIDVKTKQIRQSTLTQSFLPE